MSKFKIGTEVFYMENNIPKKSIIKGISIYTGDCEVLSGTSRKVKDGEVLFLYHTGMYYVIEENKLFLTKEELIDSISSII